MPVWVWSCWLVFYWWGLLSSNQLVIGAPLLNNALISPCDVFNGRPLATQICLTELNKCLNRTFMGCQSKHNSTFNSIVFPQLALTFHRPSCKTNMFKSQQIVVIVVISSCCVHLFVIYAGGCLFSAVKSEAVWLINEMVTLRDAGMNESSPAEVRTIIPKNMNWCFLPG